MYILDERDMRDMIATAVLAGQNYKDDFSATVDAITKRADRYRIVRNQDLPDEVE